MVMKYYPPEFKADAVALYRSRPDATIVRIAGELDVHPETFRTWIRRDDEERGKARSAAPPRSAKPVSPASGRPTPSAPARLGSLEAENAALRERVRVLEEERDILRKAARYFAGETRW